MHIGTGWPPALPTRLRTARLLSLPDRNRLPSHIFFTTGNYYSFLFVLRHEVAKSHFFRPHPSPCKKILNLAASVGTESHRRVIPLFASILFTEGFRGRG